MSFKEDLKIGKEIEEYVLSIIQQKYPKAKIMEGYFKEYDIMLPEIDKTVEVKSDIKSLETGNYVVEVAFDGKPSALSVTTAEWYVFYDGECYIWIKPQELKRISEKYGKLREFVGNGDTKSKKAYLIKKDVVKEYANFIKML